MKIGPVDTEIALLIVKKEEITEGKIYSPVGRFAERAKLHVMATPWNSCPSDLIKVSVMYCINTLLWCANWYDTRHYNDLYAINC